MRLSVALHLISFSDKNENSLPGSIISSCVKMALREKKIQSLNIFIENGIIISENIEIEDGIDFVSTTYGNFHIIKEILKPYQWNEKKIQNEHLPGNLRASLDKYFKENEGIKQGNLEFLISLNNRELFHALSLDKDDLENGSKLLGIAFKKKMLNTLLVLLQNTYIPMDNRYYDDMLKNPFTNEIDILIIKKRFNLINFEDLDASDGNSLLHKIILLKRSDLIEWILKKDCSLVKVVNRDKETAFHLALKEKDTEMFQLLWDHSEQHLKEVKDKKDVQSDTMLSLAVKYKFTDLAVKLVKFGCALQNVDHDGSNVLHLCSKENNTSLADTILSLEKNQEIMNEFDKNRDTPLHVAISMSFHDMVKIFLQKENLNLVATTDERLDYLRLAIVKSPSILKCFDLESMEKVFLEEKLKEFINLAINGNSIVCFALRNNLEINLLEWLLKSWGKKICVDSTTEEGNTTLLHIMWEMKVTSKVFDLILRCHECPGPSVECFTSAKINEHSILDKAFSNIKDPNCEAIANYILNHNDNCGRSQVVDILKKSNIIEPLTAGLKEKLLFFLCSWISSEEANILRVASELNNVKLLQAIYEKDEFSKECIKLGLNAAILYAAEKVHLETLEFLLYKGKNFKPDEIFDRIIKDKPDLLHKLIHQSAENDCPEIFRLLMNNENAMGLFDQDTAGTTNLLHSISLGKENASKNFDHLIKVLEDKGNVSALKPLLCQQDSKGNTPLHTAAQGSVNESKLKVMSRMLEKGADPSVRNRKYKTFLEMSVGCSQMLCSYISKLSGDTWFQDLIKDGDQLQKLIDLENDELFCTILQKFKDMPTVDEEAHPKSLIIKLWHRKDILKESMKELLCWEARYHRNNLAIPGEGEDIRNKSIKECCQSFDPNMNFQVFSEMEKIVHYPLTISFFVKKSLTTLSMFIFLLKFLDMAFDIALCHQYYHPGEFFKNIPSVETCQENFTLGCYFNQMNKMNLFTISIIIFIIILLADLFFVLTSKHSHHYRAVATGHCCWENFQRSKRKKEWQYNIFWLLMTIFNQIGSFIYWCIMQAILDYWKPSKKQRPRSNVEEEDQISPCKNCMNCPNQTSCFCIFCNNNATREDLQKNLQEEAFCLTTLSKVVNSATENTLMPIIQLCILFPDTIRLFPKTTIDTSDFKDIANNVESNWRFIVTFGSIVSSLLSMGVTLTETYFAKPGRHAYKNKTRWTIFFLCIIFQVVPKIFAYLVFCFGFVGHHIGPEYIIPSLLILALILSGLRAFAHGWLNGCEKNSFRASLLFGLSSIYILNEHEFFKPNPPNKQESEKKNSYVIAGKKLNKVPFTIFFDGYSCIETLILTIVGAENVVDANFNKWPFVSIMMLLQLSGLLLKGMYYLYFHPWAGLDPSYGTWKTIHFGCGFFVIAGLMITIPLIITSVVLNTIILCLVATLTIVIIVSICQPFGIGKK